MPLSAIIFKEGNFTFMVYMFLANGFEETEAICPLDLLRRAGADVRTVAVGTETLAVTGSHGITVMADVSAENLKLNDIEMVILPGGMPGSDNLFASETVKSALAEAKKSSAYIAAICAAPYILGRLGYLDGHRAVSYPGYEKELNGAVFTDAPVVTDGTIITARAAGSALPFGLALVAALFGQERADAIADAVIYQTTSN